MHFSLIVIGNGSLEEMLAPFDENIQVGEYVCGDVSEDDKLQMIGFYNQWLKENANRSPYNKHLKVRNYTINDFDQCYARFGKRWNNNSWRKNEDGVWQEFSTYNPNSKWDWWEVGGRWPGMLRVKDGVETDTVSFSWGWKGNEVAEFLKKNPNCADRAKKGDITNLAELHSWAVLKDGEWHESSYEDDKTLDLLPFLEGVSDDTYITCIDYHI